VGAGEPPAAEEASGLCLWAVGVSLTHPRSGELMTLAIGEPPLFEAARAREFEAWRSPDVHAWVGICWNTWPY
jgi:hypothetical protein